MLNLRDFGDFGDSSVDIQLAFKEASRRGIPLIVPKGFYLITDTINIEGSLHVLGTKSSMFVASHTLSGKPMFKNAYPISNVLFSSLKFDSNYCHSCFELDTVTHLNINNCEFVGRLPQTNYILNTAHCNEVNIKKNIFVNCLYAIKLEGDVYNVHITNNQINRWLHQAIILRGQTDVDVVNVTISDNKFENPAPGKGGARQMIACYNNTGVTKRSFKHLRIFDNICIGTGGFYDRNSDDSVATADQITMHYAEDFLIHHNTVKDGGEIGITVANQCKDGIISENMITGCDGHGLQVGYVEGISENIIICNNRIGNNGRREDGQGDVMAQIYLQKLYSGLISGNCLYDNNDKRRCKNAINATLSEDVDIIGNSFYWKDRVGFVPFVNHSSNNINVDR